MSPFISRMIMQAADRSEAEGVAKYEAYFVNTRLYAKWRPDVDSILLVEGYANVVSEA